MRRELMRRVLRRVLRRVGVGVELWGSFVFTNSF